MTATALSPPEMHLATMRTYSLEDSSFFTPLLTANWPISETNGPPMLRIQVLVIYFCLMDPYPLNLANRATYHILFCLTKMLMDGYENCFADTGGAGLEAYPAAQ